MTAIEYHALALHVRSVALRDAYLAFLADCIAECDRQQVCRDYRGSDWWGFVRTVFPTN